MHCTVLANPPSALCTSSPPSLSCLSCSCRLGAAAAAAVFGNLTTSWQQSPPNQAEFRPNVGTAGNARCNMTTNKCTKHTKQKLANKHTHTHTCMHACLAVTSCLCGALSFALQAICSFCVAYFFGASNFIVCVLHFTFLSSCQLPSGRVSYDPPSPSLGLPFRHAPASLSPPHPLETALESVL